MLNYRRDIDGLRAISVLSVIGFHSGIPALSGGYIGVDVFFVISGYLITSFICQEMARGTFSFAAFYLRRAARLLPALAIVLFGVLIFGFCFYPSTAFDKLGKELFFSAFGAANILFARGTDYFAAASAYQPLLHLWSLGVEEQFYLLWPLMLFLTGKYANRLVLPLACGLLLCSFALSQYAVEQQLSKGYFLLHYRAFELLIGVITALLLLRYDLSVLHRHIRTALAFCGGLLIVLPMLLLDAQSPFPGWNALWPCLGAALLIAFSEQNLLARLLSARPLVFLGLISYPLYLVHQPLISFVHFFAWELSASEMFLLVTGCGIVLSFALYHYVETPLRQAVRQARNHKPGVKLLAGLVAMPCLAALGLLVSKTNGLEQRFTYFNPFAAEITAAHQQTFAAQFHSGFQVAATGKTKALFVGDSVLQHYVVPLITALQIEPSAVDTVTRGGCVLLKGADFVDSYADISCDALRDKLYRQTKRYEVVVLSQSWESYDHEVLNFTAAPDRFSRWSRLLSDTVQHFLTLSDRVIVLGAHPRLSGVSALQPSMTISAAGYSAALAQLTIRNEPALRQSQAFFGALKQDRVIVLEPYQIFCHGACKLSGQQWSYFSDSLHISRAATPFVAGRLAELYQNHQAAR